TTGPLPCRAARLDFSDSHSDLRFSGVSATALGAVVGSLLPPLPSSVLAWCAGFAKGSTVPVVVTLLYLVPCAAALRSNARCHRRRSICTPGRWPAGPAATTPGQSADGAWGSPDLRKSGRLLLTLRGPGLKRAMVYTASTPSRSWFMSESMPVRPPRHRGIYLLPNLFTTGAMFAGFYAIISGIGGHFTEAAVAVFLAALLDGMDGRHPDRVRRPVRFAFRSGQLRPGPGAGDVYVVALGDARYGAAVGQVRL